MRAFTHMLRQMCGLLVARPDFRRLWGGETISMLGDWLSYVAVSLLALDQGQGALALAIVLLAHILPKAVLSPWAGPLVDRWDRRVVLVAGHAIQGGITAGMAAAAVGGELGLLELLLVARASVGAFTLPAQTAALRRVVAEDELLSANAFASASWSVTFALGMGLGGGVAGVTSPLVALVLDAITFAVAAGVFSGLPGMAPDADAGSDPEPGGSSLLAEGWRAGRYAWRRPELLMALLAKAPIAAASGAGWILVNLRGEDAAAFAGSAAVAIGVLHAVRGAGTGVGPLVAAWLAQRGVPSRTLIAASQIATLVAVGGFALLGAGWGLVAASVVWGMGSGANWVLTSADLQRLGPDAMLGRLAAIDNVSQTAAMSVGVWAGAIAVDASAVPELAAWVGVALGAGMWWALDRITRRPARLQRPPRARTIHA